jgi:hypothetical protein
LGSRDSAEVTRVPAPRPTFDPGDIANPGDGADPAPSPTPGLSKRQFGRGKALVAGTAEKGAILKAKLRWIDESPKPKRLSYQWFRNGIAMKPAVKSEYRVRARDVGKRITVAVTARRAGFARKTFTSAPTEPAIAASPLIDERCLTGSVLCANASRADRKLRWIVDGEVKLVLDARFARPGMVNRYGAYEIFSKDRGAYSYSYGQPMPFAMCYSGPYCIHYSAEFAEVGYGGPRGSHGCVNIRDIGWLEYLYERTPMGTKVVVYKKGK